MNNALQIFNFNSHGLRVITDNVGEVWFVAKDVATALGYSDAPGAVSKHCKKHKLLKDIGSPIQPPNKKQQLILDLQTKLIPESDVYRLVIRSKLESAEAFQDWLVEQVLPSIRKTGSYSMTGFNVPKTFAEALRLAADVCSTLELGNVTMTLKRIDDDEIQVIVL